MKSINIKILFSFILIFISLCYFYFKSVLYTHKYNRYKNDKDTINQIDALELNEFYPEDYQRDIINRIRNRLKGPIIMQFNEFAFVNGLIRKFRPKKILEIGVCSGGMSAVILNAIMDIKNSFLYSCDLESKHYLKSQFEVGCVVKNNFPEFLNIDSNTHYIYDLIFDPGKNYKNLITEDKNKIFAQQITNTLVDRLPSFVIK